MHPREHICVLLQCMCCVVWPPAAGRPDGCFQELGGIHTSGVPHLVPTAVCIFCRSTFRKGRNIYVKIGDKDVEYNKNFRLFLHTKLSNPHYPPEIQAETTLINFTVTEQVRWTPV